MLRGKKTKETFEKVAQHWENKAGKDDWAKAKNGEGGHCYQQARDNYARAERARQGGERRFPSD